MQYLTEEKKKVRLLRASLLRLAEIGELPNLVFFDEKPFVIQQFVNKQNNLFICQKVQLKATSFGHQNSSASHGDGVDRHDS